MKIIIGLAGLAASLFCSTLPANAQINVIHYYPLGEADPGAVAGGIATSSIDSAGSNNLVLTGAPVYSSDVPTNAFLSSTLSLAFTGTNYGFAPLIFIPNFDDNNFDDNYGLEVWVKPGAAGNYTIVYNGETGYNGYGIVQSGNTFEGLLGGVVAFGAGPVAINQWTELALVRANGTFTLYENYSPVGSTTAAPNPQTAGFALATDPGAPAGGFQGLIDEVRIFDFSTFNINDLVSVPTTNLPPSPLLSLTMPDSNALVAMWPQTNSGFGLQYSSDLINWTNVLADVTNGFCQVNDTTIPGGSRFYRLKYPFGTYGPPRLPPNGTLTAGFSPAPLIERGTYGGIDMEGNPCWSLHLDLGGDQGGIVIDASQVIDPEACTNGSLSFEWHLSDIYGSYFSYDYGYDIFPVNVTGYLTPQLNIGVDGLGENQTYSLRLFVFRKSDQALFGTDMNITITDGYPGPLPYDRAFANPVVYPSGLQPEPFEGE